MDYYPIDFQCKRTCIEHAPLRLHTAELLQCNSAFVMSDLEEALCEAGASALGDDGVHYDMVRHLHPKALSFLVKLYNQI